MRIIAITIVVLGFAFLAACGGQGGQVAENEIGEEISVAGGSYTDISVSELQAMLESKDFPLINVHIPFEGDLPDTDGSIPFDQIENYLDQLPEDKDAKLVLYCRSDRMSGIAA
ncbi:MAG: rhodanese-like domain-containing protein, partial [Anaerolineales bacterium]|nr:rhodanese-like domain-containing protein [Anaerolineales bacterium]